MRGRQISSDHSFRRIDCSLGWTYRTALKGMHQKVPHRCLSLSMKVTGAAEKKKKTWKTFPSAEEHCCFAFSRRFWVFFVPLTRRLLHILAYMIEARPEWLSMASSLPLAFSIFVVCTQCRSDDFLVMTVVINNGVC